MSAPSDSGSGTENAVSGGRSVPLADDALTVELAFNAHAGAIGGPSGTGPEVGTVLGSRYRLEQVIGRGGSSIVYRAKDLGPAISSDTTTRLVALKLSCGSPRTEPLALARLQREFHAMRGLSHPGIARVFELGCDGEMWFMSMQLIVGQTLKAWMGAGCTYAEALKVINTCCEALEYSHSVGIVHGDLKPTNILVTDDGTAKLIDFGSSPVPRARAGLGLDANVAATPLYASPQVLAGQGAGKLDDVFSLACLSYSILSGGRHPYGGHPSFEDFRAKSAPTYLPAIPVELFEVIERGLSPDRNRRPASVSEFRRAFMAAEQHRRVRACLSHPVNSDLVQESSSAPPTLASAIAGVARTILPLNMSSRRGLKRVWPLLVSLIALIVAAVGVAVLFPDSKAALSRPAAGLLPAARLETPQSPAIVTAASTPHLAPAPDHAPSLSAQAAPLPHDSSSISFKAAIVHVSARQSLVAITVRRTPANRAAGAFMWRVERGSAVPTIDYQPIEPRRVHFFGGQTVRTLFIPLLNKSASHGRRGPRFFDVVLQPVAGGPTLGRFARITVVIEPTPTIWVANSGVRSGTLR